MLNSVNRKVFLLYPNLIGYARAALLLLSVFAFHVGLLRFAVGSYAVSQLLDAVDGEVARRLGQCSEFGAALDMIIDRVSTIALYFAIAAKSARAGLLIFLLLLGDVGGHWLFMYTELKLGESHHKNSAHLPPGLKHPTSEAMHQKLMIGGNP
uniref:CDP-diacylglycerol--inositol 3-phosphatidyltransferase-like n=1 Tax=Dermatophagoides pteronyssinus TaxID=6956 RepID=A0A6P6XYS3_DERPT|nr:CDP-diacylglycerol--inositol 3-phosphatidyltransferase-like [Dermatophagoides pteronyssinus]